MAQYKHLPIYKTTYELLTLVTRKTKDFPRDFKYSLGDKIRGECIDLVVLIYKANSFKHRKEFVGYIIRPRCTYVRRSTIDSMYRNIRTRTDFEALRATTNSYLGMLRHANAYRERRRLAAHLGLWGAWFNGKLTKLIKTGGA
jgi:hypothetical protein